MNFQEVLIKIVKTSGISIKEIATRINESGEQITPSYISMMMKSGKAPKPNISKAICKVLNYPEDMLIVANYLDNAPECMKNWIQLIEESIHKSATIGNKLNLNTTTMSYLNNIHSDVQSFGSAYFISLVFGDQDIVDEVMKSSDEYIENISTTFSDLSYIVLEDTAMSPALPFKFKAMIDTDASFKKDDLIVFRFINEENRYRIRYYREIDGIQILTPENSMYPPIFVNDKIEIIGKVTRYVVDID